MGHWNYKYTGVQEPGTRSIWYVNRVSEIRSLTCNSNPEHHVTCIKLLCSFMLLSEMIECSLLLHLARVSIDPSAVLQCHMTPLMLQTAELEDGNNKSEIV